ncbi:hypothetical protein CLU79DRAFT_882952 [Phycomyces nitens]|nr:hypothetical protein CLU79DRAFT_882952 [Phycomyces nitens]
MGGRHTQSDVVYAPRDESLGHPPIIVEVQHSVNFAFINRSIRYCTLAYQRFKTLPVLVIFCINGTSGIPDKLLGSSSVPGAMDVSCDLWAKNCHLINNSSVKKWIGEALDPFAALSLLLVDQETCLLESKGWKDPTMVRLFEILEQLFAKSLDRESQLLDALKSVCEANIKVYEEILSTSGRLSSSSAIDQHAKQGIEKMRSVKRQFQEDDDQDAAATKSDSSPESSIRSFDEERYQRTMEFTGQFKKTRKRMNWKDDGRIVINAFKDSVFVFLMENRRTTSLSLFLKDAIRIHLAQ